MSAMRASRFDLTPHLEAWSYDESQTVRRVRARDGRHVIQVRLPLGIEQYEIDGRPDGLRPMQRESWLHYYFAQAQAAEDAREEMHLSSEDFSRLHQEGLLYYYRYLLFFQIQDYKLCVRDTRRNLKLVDFVSRFAAREQAELLEQYRPYILRMNYMARALHKVVDERRDLRGALRTLQAAVKAIEALPPMEGNQVFAFEKARSLKSIEELMAQLEAHVPRHVALNRQLERAIRDEDYEQAATLRDEIAQLRRTMRSQEKR
jgi:hypothetical protein